MENDVKRSEGKIVESVPSTNSRAVLQWKYASCKYNLAEKIGFATFSKSEGLSTEEQKEIEEKVAFYSAPDGAPPRPKEVDLANPRLFPVAFSFFTLKNERRVLCRTRATGETYEGGRFGGFFAHALIFEKDAPLPCPIDYWDSKAFARGLSSEEINLGRVPDPLPTFDLSDLRPDEDIDAIARKFKTFSPKYGAFIVDRFLSALKEGKKLVVVGALESDKEPWPALFVKAVYESLPTSIADVVRFTTYANNPQAESALFQDDASAFAIIFVSRRVQCDWKTDERYAFCDVQEAKSEDWKPLCSGVEALQNGVLPRFANGSKESGRRFRDFADRFILSRYRNDGAKLIDALESVSILWELDGGGSLSQNDLIEVRFCDQVDRFLCEQLDALNDLKEDEKSRRVCFADLLRFDVRCDKERGGERWESVDEEEAAPAFTGESDKADGEAMEETQVDAAQKFKEEAVAYWTRLVANDSDDSRITDAPKLFAEIFERDGCVSALAYMREIDRRLKEKSGREDGENVDADQEIDQSDADLEAESEERRRNERASNLLILELGVYSVLYYDKLEDAFKDDVGEAAFYNNFAVDPVDPFNAREIMRKATERLEYDDVEKIWSAFLPAINKDATRRATLDVLKATFASGKSAISDEKFFHDLIKEKKFAFLDRWRGGKGWDEDWRRQKPEISPAEEATINFFLNDECCQERAIDVCSQAFAVCFEEALPLYSDKLKNCGVATVCRDLLKWIDKELSSLKKELESRLDDKPKVDELIAPIRSDTVKKARKDWTSELLKLLSDSLKLNEDSLERSEE